MGRAMRPGVIFGRLLLAATIATATFALAAASGILPLAVAKRSGPEGGGRGQRGAPDVEMSEVAELLREAGFSELGSPEREHGLIEVKATGPDGRRYEIEIDPKTRAIVGQEEDD
jgi:hypothetical protein